MRLKNFLITVEDIEKSRNFYHSLFGLDVLTDFGGNMILTEGLVLQDRKIWNRLIGQEAVCGDADAELYFEENDMDTFLQKLEQYPEPIEYLNPLMEHSWGQRVVRIYDPDRHVIEVGEAMDFVAQRFYKSGMTLEETAEKTQLPLEQVRRICGV